MLNKARGCFIGQVVGDNLGSSVEFLTKADIFRKYPHGEEDMLRTRDSRTAVLETVNGGGDADTNAAICGALFGAMYGIDSIPSEWTAAVLNSRPASENGASLPRPTKDLPGQVVRMSEILLSQESEN